MPKPYFIRMSSQKGGVGKTVISVNLAIALGKMGKKVLLADADLANPSVGIHLKLDSTNMGIRDVLWGHEKIDNMILNYLPGSMDVLLGAIAEGEIFPVTLTSTQIDRVGEPLQKSDYDFVIFDTSPGIIAEDVLKYYDEVLLITLPDLPSLTSLMRLSLVYQKHDVISNVVVNRITGSGQEVGIGDIEQVINQKVLCGLPEDAYVSTSIAKQIPMYISNPEGQFTNGITGLAEHYVKLKRTEGRDTNL